MSRADGNSERTRSAPEYGVAASRVSLISRMFAVTAAPLTASLAWDGAGQVRQGALNQVLSHARNGLVRWIRRASRTCVLHAGRRTSLHCTAR